MLTLAQANTIISEGLKEGERRGFNPLCFAVVDPSGRLVSLQRDPRGAFLRGDIAIAKATACVGFGLGGRALVNRSEKAPGFFAAVIAALETPVLPAIGGVLIRDSVGNILGAVGVSGDVADNDEICALVGVAAAELVGEAGA